MRYAETGFNLEVDLTRGNIERVPTDPHLSELHLGGLGTNARIMWDRVGPEVEPFDPENLLIFGTGLLAGTPAPGCNRTIVSSISPQTKLSAFSMMGGFWGPELKHAGYDKVIIRGKAPDLVYLYINDDTVEIRDATQYRGLGTFETASLLRQEFDDQHVQVSSIGLAGELKVFFASIEQGRSSASRLGMGAIMGDKNLKAIAVRGSKDIWQGSGHRRRWRCTMRSGTPKTSCGAMRVRGGRASGPRRSKRSGRTRWRPCGLGSLAATTAP
jgi:aldehyde:ferredoxin oxidoreductase